MPRLRESRDDLLALITEAAKDISYPAAWVEKDYWITEILRSLAEPFGDHLVVFKGGTSLSKAWHLIQRMSEDVDILLVSREGAGSGARDKALKALTKRTADDIGLEPTLVTSGTGVRRATVVKYPTIFEDPTVPGEVLIEIGVRGGPNPNESKTIRSFIAEYALKHAVASVEEYDEFRSLEIHCLKPERTLVEKLSALHHLATKILSDANTKVGTSMRHYYDVAMLLSSGDLRESLQEGVVCAIAEDVEARSAAAEWRYTARPAGGYGESPAFTEAFLSRGEVREAYERVLNLVVGGPRPSLDTVAREVLAASKFL